MMRIMPYRPRPDRNRALRQIMRRHRNQVPSYLLSDVRSERVEPGEYRLSTRRLRGVSTPR